MDIKISINLPCYGRPQRTKRAIECIINQDISGWEAFIAGDCCPDFQKLIDSGYLEQIKKDQEKKGNLIHYFNNQTRGGGCGYQLINHAISNASGRYFVFFGNDDVILPNHFSNYLEIEDTNYDFMFFQSWIDPLSKARVPMMEGGSVGHSELIVKTPLAKKLPLHSDKYGHDWDFIDAMIKNGKGGISESTKQTYRVMHTPMWGTKDIID